METNYSNLTSLIETQEDILAVINVIGSDKPETRSALKKYKGHDFAKLYYTLLDDHSKGKKVFTQMLKDKTRDNVALFRELNTILKQKCLDDESALRNLKKKKKDTYSSWSKLAEEKESLQTENKKMTTELNEFLEKKRWLASKRDFINYKLNEYGDERRINELFQEWSEDYKQAKSEEKSLKVEYEKASEDERILPRVCGDIKSDIDRLKEDMDYAKYEVEEILKAFPDIEERAKESEDIVLKYREIHKNFEEITGSLNDLTNQFLKVEREEKKLRQELSLKKEELAPFVETENSLKSQLAELTESFNRQEDLKDQNRALKDVIKPMERKIEDWKEKIKNHDEKSIKMNQEIESLKEVSGKMVAEIKELEALVGPVRDLRARQEAAKKETAELGEQDKTLTKEIKKLKKENDILSIKARQFQMIKKKLEALK